MTKFPSKKTLAKIRKEFNSAPASQALPKNASCAEKFKYELCEHFVIFKNKSELTQRELAKKLKISETTLSRILHYHIEDFTIDRLINLLEILYPSMHPVLQAG
jgi:predicted XRE-type DNA-binding protein